MQVLHAMSFLGFGRTLRATTFIVHACVVTATPHAGLACNELPDLVIETEAEYARRRNWERVFPCPSDPSRYLDLFETPRAASIMVCNYLAQKAGGSLQGGAGQGGRPGTTPVTPSGRSRPAINTWRPSGMT